jgi:ATP-dependent protease ClpP protease subunit
MSAPIEKARVNSPRRFKPMNRGDRREWYRIENKKGDTARIDVYDAIGYDPFWDEGIAVTDFAKEVRAIKASKIELHINSPGGAAFDGVTMYNAVRDHPAFVEVTVDGLAASAASVLAMSGDEIIMNRASELMLHEASGMCWGNADDMAETGAILDRLSADIAAIYADRAGGTAKQWRDIMRGEQWYAASEAVDAGLADRVVELKEEDATEAKNRFDLRIFAHAGRSHAPAPKLRATSPELTRASVPANKVAKPEDGMTPEQLEVIGLPEDATDEQISDRLAELAQIEANADGGDETPDPDDNEPDESDEDDTEESDEDEGDETDSAEDEASTTEVPDGTVLVDKASFEDMKAKLGQVDTLLAKEVKRERDAFITNALNKGKFRASQRKDYEELYDSNPAAARKLINKLAENVVPVEELGHGGSGEDAEAEATAYPTSYLTPAEKARIKQAQEA